MVDGQVQGIHLSATVRILMTISVITTGDVFCPIPSIALASGINNSGMYGGVDGQVQRNNRIATCRVRQREGRFVGAFRVCHAIYPSERLAGYLLVGAGGGLINNQVVRHNTIAACGGQQGINQRRRGSINDSIPCVAIAHYDGIAAGYGNARYGGEYREPTIHICRICCPMVILSIRVVGVHPSVEGREKVCIRSSIY